ncbi:MAG: hypothetical protein BWY23_01701 [Spirochaetes bacterium ADurb.Bin218]|jgi:hypothetical protein|nr:hypothetical protein [Spirochaetota bacterium]OQA97133.1 MAG: hypothetical protein BWY23_01701 [Spirochaetes bacterium ADurb.Bin218]HOK03067.1 hypothetical protein [Spirochaetota bacterium]HOQ12659.1 hypothetical protein [Spirochaetota bacterium]HOV09036.1 hypothetical protein [Spirochaetota bacterium]
MRFFCKLTIFLVVSAFFSGCLYSKSHPVAIEESAAFLSSPNYEVIGEAEGSSSSFTLFSIFSVTPKVSIDEAIVDAIRSKGGDNLIEVKITREKRVYIIGTVDIVHVHGKVIRYYK